MSATTTFAPTLANSSALARPMPDPDPVITTTRPSSPMSLLDHPSQARGLIEFPGLKNLTDRPDAGVSASTTRAHQQLMRHVGQAIPPASEFSSILGRVRLLSVRI